MTLVIVIRHIDLSVGFLAGFLGAIAAIAMVPGDCRWLLVILLVLALGIIAGLITAFPVAKMGIPSFVASLAGWLIYRGALLLVTEGTGTIIIPDKAFNAIGNGFIPDIPGLGGFLPGVHKLTLLLGMVGDRLVHHRPIQRPQEETGLQLRSPAAGYFRPEAGLHLGADRLASPGCWRATTACRGRWW